MHFTGQIVKKTVAPLYHGAIKRNELLIHATIWKDLKGIILSEKKPISKGNIMYDFIYVIFLK